MEVFTSKKIICFGGAGFIGSHLVDRLIELGHEALVMDNLSSGKMENVNPKAKFLNIDITKLKANEEVVGGVDYVFHLAAIPRVPYSVEHPVETHDANVTGTLNVLEFARRWDAKKVIFASSSSVYGDNAPPQKEKMERRPISPYALHKSIGEQYMSLYDTLYGVLTLSLRFFNVYGKRSDPDSPYYLVIGKFLKAKKEGKPLTIFGTGEQSRDFTYITDVVDGLVKAMESSFHNEVINLCNGKNTSINKVAELIGGEKEYLPARKGDVFMTLGSPNKAKKLLGWKGKVEIKEGIKLMESGS